VVHFKYIVLIIRELFSVAISHQSWQCHSKSQHYEWVKCRDQDSTAVMVVTTVL